MLLGRHRGKGRDIDKMNLKEIECKCIDWIHLTQDLVNIIIKFQVL